MSYKIWKYQIPKPVNEIEMPHNARILDVQLQLGIPCIWVVVDTDLPTYIRTIKIHPTGGEIEGMWEDYIGTFQLAGGDLIFHVFDYGEDEINSKDEMVF